MPHAQIHHLTKFGEDSIQNEEVVSKNVNVDRRTHRHTDRQTDDRHLAWVYHKHPWPYGQWVLKIKKIYHIAEFRVLMLV